MLKSLEKELQSWKSVEKNNSKDCYSILKDLTYESNTNYISYKMT